MDDNSRIGNMGKLKKLLATTINIGHLADSANFEHDNSC